MLGLGELNRGVFLMRLGLPDPLLRPLLEMDRLVSDESDLELSRPGGSGDGLSSGVGDGWISLL